MTFRFHVALAPLLVLSCPVACVSSDDDVGTGPTGPTTCAPTPAAQKPAASCEVTLELPPVPANASNHVPEGTAVTYCSNPPSSGPHYPVWASFQETTTVVPAPYLVHSLEHGAVILYYKCDPPGCPEIVEQLRAVRDAAADDPSCGPPSSPRIIIAPSTTIPTKVAAAAWGATYQAACVDRPTLDAFVRDHYAKGPEDLCVPGRTF